ncbi:MAG: hypothetical protein A3K19_32425 [Lentisphaerae bacterium RIFOXYB12_FULL_65_16]|nr:MAG: hypothetical protein A3K18_11930 [Lentisphaerae bacterium RIFOXYA12_64_32]OGV85725.1 MAG: hypothetical protein A3K19_32425 [Lentisphaerae bacterium RIFOXYB12_FULL_65_16]
MRRTVILATLFVLAVFASVGARADVGLPGVFADGMVFQCQAKCPVWGTAGEGEQVTVSFREWTATGTAKAGVWCVDVDAGEAGGPFVLTVQGTNRIEIHDVYVGDVWIVSGQSNASQAATFETPKDDPDGVRFHLTAELAAKDGGTRWVTGGRVAMLGWHFGREMRLRHKVPIGIISCAWGGTSIEQWKPGPISHRVPIPQGPWSMVHCPWSLQRNEMCSISETSS